jgi:hypothetical protein
LLLNKKDNYADYEIGYFEQCLSEAFDVNMHEKLTAGTRTLYFAQTKR